MARAPKVPTYSLHKPSGRAVVKLPDPATGNRRMIYLGAHGSVESREAYAKLVANLLAGRTVSPPQPNPRGTITPEPSITVDELAEKYKRHAKGYYRKNGRPTSEVHSIHRAVEFLTANHSDLPAAAFGIGDLKAVREAIVNAALARSTVNKYVDRIRRAFKWGAAEELIPAAVAQALTLLPGLKIGRTTAPETEPVEPVADDVVNATLPELSPTIKAMVELQRATGMRPAEVCSVRPCDLDRSSDVWKYTPAEHKTQHHGKRRVVLIGPRGQAVLAPFLFRGAEEFCFRPSRATGTPRKVKRYRVDSYRRAISRACKRAGVESWAPNQLRHTFGTEARAAFGLEAAQVLLGHSRAAVTEHYAERDVRAGEAAARQIG